MEDLPRRFSVAPMLDWTDNHCRTLHRIISKQALLYTEMVTTGAILRGDQHGHLAFNLAQNPVALQLGGSDPVALAQCSKRAEAYGYAEINLNVGCPSDRVQNGQFGACLMANPTLVADCVAAMRAAVSLPVTVKCRIGIDEQDSYAELVHFVQTVAAAGCQTFIVHARKAWLSGLSPKQNREIPPLRYEVVFQLKQDFPQSEIVLNGGLSSLSACEAVLPFVDGVMMGREAYHNPYILSSVDACCYGITGDTITRVEILAQYRDYMQTQLAAGRRLSALTRPLLGLFHAQPGARAWRRHISEHAHKQGAGIAVVDAALDIALANTEAASIE